MTRDKKIPESCPCGASDTFLDCCGRLLGGGRAAETAEQLMRSRYTAYVLGDAGYLRQTWHPSSRPDAIEFDATPTWFGLEILAVKAGDSGDEQGEVEFMARYLDGGRVCVLHETSRFVRGAEQWVYLDGIIHAQPTAAKISRNDPCPCGSGRKFKHCCGV